MENKDVCGKFWARITFRQGYGNFISYCKKVTAVFKKTAKTEMDHPQIKEH
jgi:hypothetical protein